MNPRKLLGARVIDGRTNQFLNLSYKIGDTVDDAGFVKLYWYDGTVGHYLLNKDFMETMIDPTDTVILSKTTILKQYFGLP